MRMFSLASIALTLFSASLLPVCSIPVCLGEDPIWLDEFDGKSLDYSKWECEVNSFGGGNNELQMYTDRATNIRVEAGKLIIEARKENTNIVGTQRDYSSARIRTKRRGDWTYGRFDICAKLPKGQGIWPAIWMLPSDEKYGSWAASGEIDIMEYKGQEPTKIHTTLHFGGSWPNNRFKTAVYEAKKGSFTDEFHVFSLDWRKGKMVWLIDNEPIQTFTEWDSDGGKFPAPFDQPYHLLINLAVGGGFVGDPNETTVFPQRLEVDYVRVFR